ncbi:unnamed protein product [Moneuplotes crassus]|uniref:Uncharacterized protein n=1 Tax=Euplotes crassus TaxID=5936 RepID=A0AAD1XYI3_EUPCR|nr:unnamed protein product [Moneuplotes crassus]
MFTLSQLHICYLEECKVFGRTFLSVGSCIIYLTYCFSCPPSKSRGMIRLRSRAAPMDLSQTCDPCQRPYNLPGTHNSQVFRSEENKMFEVSPALFFL